MIMINDDDDEDNDYDDNDDNEDVCFIFVTMVTFAWFPFTFTDVGFKVGGNSDIDYLVLQVHYKTAEPFKGRLQLWQ